MEFTLDVLASSLHRYLNTKNVFHLSQVHKLTQEERAELLTKKKPPILAQLGNRNKETKRVCPVERCGFATDRLHDHLAGKLRLKGDMWQSASLNIVDIARQG